MDVGKKKMKENDFKWLKKHPYKSQVGFMMFLLKSFCKKKKKKILTRHTF